MYVQCTYTEQRTNKGTNKTVCNWSPKLNIIKLMDKVTTDKVEFDIHDPCEASLLSRLIFSGIQTLGLLSQDLTKTVQRKIQIARY